MDLKLLEAQGLIEKANFSVGQIKANLGRARRDLLTAKANLKIAPNTQTEPVKSLEGAEQFVKEIIQRIEKLNPQERLEYSRLLAVRAERAGRIK